MSPKGIRFLHQIQASNVMLFYCCGSSRAGLPTFIFYPFYFFPTLYKEIFFKHIPDHLRILLNQHSLTLAGVGEGDRNYRECSVLELYSGKSTRPPSAIHLPVTGLGALRALFRSVLSFHCLTVPSPPPVTNPLVLSSTDRQVYHEASEFKCILVMDPAHFLDCEVFERKIYIRLCLSLCSWPMTWC